MFDKYLQVDKHYLKVINEKSTHIKILGDLHHCDSFCDKKLEKIERKLQESPTDYLCIVGDLIDSTGYLFTNKEKREVLIKWLKRLGEQYKVFLTLGNHDFSNYEHNIQSKNIVEDFFLEMNNINGLFLSHYNSYYEDENVIVYQLELSYEYYYSCKHENIDILLKTFEEKREEINNLDDKKIKILMIHSPMHLINNKVFKYIKKFDFIFAGHMHNGMVHPFISNIIPGR